MARITPQLSWPGSSGPSLTSINYIVIPASDTGLLSAGDGLHNKAGHDDLDGSTPTPLGMTRQFRHALEDAGCYFIINHGGLGNVIAAAFAAAKEEPAANG